MNLPDSNTFYSKLGEKIKSIRNSKKISQEQLADQLELTRLSIINLEKGRHKPSIYQLLQIANYLGVTLMALIPPTTKKTTSPKNIRIVTDQNQKLDKTTQAFVNKILNDLNS